MTDAILSYRAMAYNNGWANHRLLVACARLSQSEFVAPRTGFFPSVRATLNHILVVDLFYVDAMEGGALGPAAWADPEPCATMDALRQAQADVDRRLIAVVERLDANGLERVVEVHRSTRIQHERIGRLLLVPDWSEIRCRFPPKSPAAFDRNQVPVCSDFCTHLAPTDIFQSDFDRQLYRITLVGQPLVGVDGRPSTAIEGLPILSAAEELRMMAAD